jgi:ribosomal protein S18 acetylase RimI-like enzyme
MSITIRAMAAGEEDAVAGMVHALARHIGTATVPKLDGAALRQNAGFVDVVIAEENGALLGASLGLMTFSTWRGAKGLYIVDLFVDPAARNRQIGLKLLRESARRFWSRGARFIKLEVDVENSGAGRFYLRHGFVLHHEDRLFILEPDGMEKLAAV